MSNDRPVTQACIEAVQAVIVNSIPNSLALSDLLSTQSHFASSAMEWFRGSAVLSRAVIANLLTRLSRKPVHTVDSAAIDRAFAAHESMGSLPSRREPLGISDVNTIGAMIRGESVSDHDLHDILGTAENSRATTRAKLEAARAARVLESVLATWLVAAFHGQRAELADILRALAAPRYAV